MLSALDPSVTDEHSVLLWQTCAYADDLVAAATSHGPLGTQYDAMLEFLHYRLLPYLGAEERALPPTDPDAVVLVEDHNRIRADIDALDSARTRRALAGASTALVRRLDQHVQREDGWAGPVTAPASGAAPAAWALPLLLGDEIDLADLPPDSREALVLARLRRMRLGEAVLLRADHDLHPLWRRLHAVAPGDHGWAYEVAGPSRWAAEVTRRDLDAG
jgi:uncharacterized protein (DUF2249 family)